MTPSLSTFRVGTHTCLPYQEDENEGGFGFHIAFFSHIDYSYWPRYELAKLVDESDSLCHCSKINSTNLVCLINTLCYRSFMYLDLWNCVFALPTDILFLSNSIPMSF